MWKSYRALNTSNNSAFICKRRCYCWLSGLTLSKKSITNIFYEDHESGINLLLIPVYSKCVHLEQCNWNNFACAVEKGIKENTVVIKEPNKSNTALKHIKSVARGHLSEPKCRCTDGSGRKLNSYIKIQYACLLSRALSSTIKLDIHEYWDDRRPL